MKKILSLMLTIISILSMSIISLAAEVSDYDESKEYVKYSSIEEFKNDDVFNLNGSGIKIIGGKTEEVVVQPADGTRSVYTVWVDWKIGYHSGLGLHFYTKAYSKNLNCLLKRMNGTTGYTRADNGMGNNYTIQTTLTVPTYVIHNTVETGQKFASGTSLRCKASVDIDAISEITGGVWSGSDTVTIP